VNSQLSVLKKCKQKVQATTSDRMNINTAQQYRWHREVDEVYEFIGPRTQGYASYQANHLVRSCQTSL